MREEGQLRGCLTEGFGNKTESKNLACHSTSSSRRGAAETGRCLKGLERADVSAPGNPPEDPWDGCAAFDNESVAAAGARNESGEMACG